MNIREAVSSRWVQDGDTMKRELNYKEVEYVNDITGYVVYKPEEGEKKIGNVSEREYNRRLEILKERYTINPPIDDDNDIIKEEDIEVLRKVSMYIYYRDLENADIDSIMGNNEISRNLIEITYSDTDDEIKGREYELDARKDPLCKVYIRNMSGYFSGEWQEFRIDYARDVITKEVKGINKAVRYERTILYPETNYILCRTWYNKSSYTYKHYDPDYEPNDELIEQSVYQYGEKEYVEPNRFLKTKSARK